MKNSLTEMKYQAESLCCLLNCDFRLNRVKLVAFLLFLGLFLTLQSRTAAQGTGQPPPLTPNNQNLTPQKSRLTKLAPDSVLVQLNNGVGQATVVYARKVGEVAPVLDWTDAVGPTNTISKDKIKAQWVGQPQKVDQYETVVFAISVDTREWVEPKVTYKGRVIFEWPDTAPEIQDFIITNTVAADFNISRPKIDSVLLTGQPTKVDLIVGNVGQEKITKLTFSSDDLEDATTHRRVDFGTLQSVTVDLAPGSESSVSFALPQPSFAGTYIGTLNVIANDRVRKSIPLSVITRGPTFGAVSFLPFILFCITLALGYWLTTYLEQWFGLGGLERAQALLALEQAKTDLTTTLKKIKAWEATHLDIQLDTASTQIATDLRELDDLLKGTGKQSLDALKSAAARFTTLAAAAKILFLKVQTATEQWSLSNLKPVIDDLDALPFPSAMDGVDDYRKELAKVLIKHAGTKLPTPAGAPMFSPSDVLAERVTADQLELKIERMNLLHWLVVIIVVFVTAYTTLYWKDADFGTLLDYLTVFLWALGLSTTGASILTRGKSSFTRPG